MIAPHKSHALTNLHRCTGYVGWTDIAVEVNGQPVADAQWVAAEENPDCHSKVTIHTWSPCVYGYGAFDHPVCRSLRGDDGNANLSTAR